MTNRIDTAFDRTFSEPPNVVVAEGRTHCDACKEPLDPNVMHKCAGNQEWKPIHDYTPRPEHYTAPQLAHPDLSNYKGVCPECHGKKHEPDVQHEPCTLCGGAGMIG